MEELNPEEDQDPEEEIEESPKVSSLRGKAPLKPPYLIPDEQFKQIQEDFYIMQKIGKHDLH